MRRAGKLMLLALMLAALGAGCDGTGMTPPWARGPKERGKPPVASEPVDSSPATRPASEIAEQSDEPDPEPHGPLAQRIDAYLAQFSSDSSQKDEAAPPAEAKARLPEPENAETGDPNRDRPESISAGQETSPPTTRPAAVPITQVPPVPEPPIARPTPATPPIAHKPDVDTADPTEETSITREPKKGAEAGRPEPVPASESSRPRVELIDVRPMSPTHSATEASPPAPTANQSAETATPGERPTGIADMIGQLERSIAENPEHLDEQLKLRLLYLATAQDDKARRPVENVDPVKGELLSAFCDVIACARQVMSAPKQGSAKALMAVDDLRRLLGQQSSVLIQKVALVTRVGSFGDYDAVSPARFAAGRGVNVFVYVEVANYRSEPTRDGRLRTLLSETVEVYDAGGKVIWERTESKIEDRTLSPRRDFFIPFPVTLPPDTPAGEYILKVTIEDRLGATTDQQRITFTIE